MANVQKNIIRANFNLTEIVFEIRKIKELLKDILQQRKVSEKKIHLLSIEGGLITIDSNKIEVVEEYVGTDDDYEGAKSVVYMVSSNFFHVKQTMKQVNELREQ